MLPSSVACDHRWPIRNAYLILKQKLRGGLEGANPLWKVDPWPPVRTMGCTSGLNARVPSWIQPAPYTNMQGKRWQGYAAHPLPYLPP